MKSSTCNIGDCYVQRMRRRGYVVAGVVVVLAFGFTSCAAQQPAFPEFSREQTAADLPAAIVESGEDIVELDSVRHVGDVDGYDLYLARGREAENAICVAIVKDGAWESTGCGSDGVTVTTRSGAKVEAGGLSGADETKALSDSVRVVR